MFSPPSSCLTWCGGWPPELSLWITLFRDPCSMWDLEIHRKLLIGYFPTWQFRAFQQSPWLHLYIYMYKILFIIFFLVESFRLCASGPPLKRSVDTFLPPWRSLSVFGRILRILMLGSLWAHQRGHPWGQPWLSCSIQKYEWYLMALFRAWVLCSRFFS